MTSSPPEAETPEEAAPAPHPLEDYARAVAEAVGGEFEITFDTIKVMVSPDQWVAALTTARDDFDLVSFSFVSAIDWSNSPEVGDPLKEELDEEFFEMLATVADVTEGKRVTFSTRLGRENPVIDSLIEVYAGADWHEREAREMFGIDFAGHPDLAHLYLPENFIGHPLLKSFPLLSREVKPWPGKVDVEAMPEDEPDEEQPDEGETEDAGDPDVSADDDTGESS